MFIPGHEDEIIFAGKEVIIALRGDVVEDPAAPIAAEE